MAHENELPEATEASDRLLAVLSAVEEAIFFSDRNNVLRLVNRRAADLFQLEPRAGIGTLVVDVRRRLALQMEDPEGFMEIFQELRGTPEMEIKTEIEQIVPARRRLRLSSSPARDRSGEIIGRIDVYTDVTESLRREAEIQRLLEQARNTAESYQRSLLPDSVPPLPRVNMVAHYIPAAGRRAVCGDFYDFVPLADGKIALVLGDVCGTGPQAVNDAALCRYTLRSICEVESDPARLLEHMNSLIAAQMSSDRFVRILLAVLEPERGLLRYASAGHVPPICYRARRGEVEWLGEGGIALAVERGVRYKLGSIELEPGDMLFFYTDGLTEAPRHGRPFGQGRLTDLVLQYGVGTPGEIVQACRRAVDAWVSEELRDDLAMIGLQVVPDAAMGEPVRELVLPNEPARTREVRSFVAAFLADLRCPVDMSADILLSVGEAAANATIHGRRRDARSEIRVRCERAGPSVVVTVADEGLGFEPAGVTAALPDHLAPGGRGLFLMRELMDDVDIRSTGDGTTVQLRRHAFGDSQRDT